MYPIISNPHLHSNIDFLGGLLAALCRCVLRFRTQFFVFREAYIFIYIYIGLHTGHLGIHAPGSTITHGGRFSFVFRRDMGEAAALRATRPCMKGRTCMQGRSKKPLVVLGTASTAAFAFLAIFAAVVFVQDAAPRVEAQPARYMDAASWKKLLDNSDNVKNNNSGQSWFTRW